MAETTVTLITGPNRGIGRGLLAAFLARPNNTVIAAVRDPQAPASQGLNALTKGEGSTLHIVKIDSAVDDDAANAAKTLQAGGIKHIDTVIANAAMGEVASSVLDTPAEAVRKHMDVNLIGILTLFQATEPLLKVSSNPKFFAMSSNLSSMGLMEHIPGPWFCYGATKAALNHMTRRIHFENQWLTAVALHPGWVKTDMGDFAAKCVGVESPPLALEDSVKGCIKVIDEASREKCGGAFISYDEQTVLW